MWEAQKARTFSANGPLLGAVFCCAAVSTVTSAQHATLPPTPPTTATPVAPTAAGPSGLSMSGSARHRASVSLSGNTLEIHADNSSLNAILREIAAQTGMNISGGVLDQRVFGSYGPGPAPEIVSQLLQDTGVNVILEMSPSGRISQLSLTPRLGGPTPPSPSTFRDDDDVPAATAGKMPQPAAPTPPSVQPVIQPLVPSSAERAPVTPDPAGFVSTPTLTPSTAPASQNPATTIDPNSSTGSSGTNPQSPNGVRTPQQIFEELQKLQQQQQKQPGS